ncbi:MAG: NfeD family protein [Phycisphaerales bacterium]
MEWLVWGLILLGLAFGLLILEIFVPTAGILGITSLALACVGVFCLFRASLGWGLGGLTSVLIGGPTTFFYGLKVYRQTALGKKMTSADADEVVAAAREEEEEAFRARLQLMGREGEVVTELRPVGVVKIGDQRYDALSETTLVSSGAKVRVTGVEPTQLRVRPL